MRYNIQNAPSSASQVGQEPQATQVQANDTLPKVKKTTITTLADTAHASIDLRDPENLKTEADYDDETGGYRFGTKLGDEYIGTPFSMTWQEYQDLAMKRSIARYYRQKNAEEFKQKGKDKFDFTDMHFDLGPMNKI